MDPSQLKDIVQKERKHLRLSRVELAKSAGVSKTLIFEIENGKLSIRLDKLLKIFNVLKIEINIFKEEKNEENSFF